MDLSGLPDDTLSPGLDLGGLPDTNAKVLREQYRTTTSTPDDAAKVIDITKRTGIPKPVVERNRQEAERKAFEPDWGDLEVSAPITVRELAANTKLFELANDDTENMRQIERTMNRRSAGLIGGPAFDRSRGTMQASIGPEASFSTIVAGQMGVLPNTFERIRQGLRLEIADLFGFETVQQDALRQRQRVDSAEALQAPEFDSTLGRWVYGGASNVQRVVPSIAAGIATRSPAVGLAAMGAQVQPETYGKYRARGGTPGEAAFGSGLETGIEIGTEMLPMGFLVNRFGKAGATQFIAGYLGRELPTEIAAEVAQDAVDTAIANPDKTWGEYVKELPDTVGQTVVSTLMMSGGLTVANEAARRLAGRWARLARAARDAEVLAQLSQLAAASKLRARDPQTFQDFVAAANEDGPVQDIYIDARTLQQAGVDPALLAQASPTAAAQLEEALATGGDLVIPMAEYAARIAGTDLDPVLTPHLRTAEDALSLMEAQTFYQGQAEEFQKVAAKVMEEKATDDAWQASAKAVETALFNELKNTARFTDDVNSAYATLMRDFYVATASRLGITPEEMFARYPIKVAAERAVGDARMEQPTGPLPTEKLAEFGEFKTGQPVTFNFVHNTESATKLFGKPKKGDRFQRDLEPSGRYVQAGKAWDGMPANLTAGTITFNNPLVVKGENWKELLAKHYGKTGKNLSKAIIADGHDGVVTVDKYGTSEILDLTTFDEGKALYQGGLQRLAQSVMQALGLQQPQAEAQPVEESRGPALDMGQFFQGQRETDGKQIKSSIGNSGAFDPNNPDILAQGNRGEIAFGRDITQTPSVITLFNNADLSTFLHEMGHFQLEVLAHIASQPNAPAEIVQDLEKVLAWFGIRGDENVAGGETAGSLGQPETPDQQFDTVERLAKARGWNILSRDSSNISSSRYMRIEKPLEYDPEYGVTEYEVALLRFADHANRRVTEDVLSAALDLNIAPGALGFDEALTLLDEFMATAVDVPGRFYQGDETVQGGETAGSLGQPGDPAFDRWFGDSKVVDKRGDPLRVYHGTNETTYTPRVTKAGSESARKELQQMADKHGIKEWNDVPVILERWVSSGIADQFGVTKQVAEHARELQRQAKATEESPARADLAFNVFNMPGGGTELGAHFGTKAQASTFGKPFEFYLNLQNPLRLPDLGTWDYQSVMREARKRGVQISEAEYDAVFNASDSNAALRDLLASKGYDGVVYANEAEGKGDSYIAFRPEQIKSATDNRGTFDPNDPNIYRQGGEEGTKGELPKRRTALEVWQAMSLEEKRPYHEMFARGFEAYLFEGKAPSQELTGLFARFRSWLINVYKSIKALNVEISDDIRQVFDRMVATDEAIKQAEAARAMTPLFPDNPEVQAAAAEATQTAVDQLQRRSLRDMQWLTNARGRLLKQMQKDAKAKRQAVEDEVRAEVEALPAYQAQAFLNRPDNLDPAVTAAQAEWSKQREERRAFLAEQVKAEVLARPEAADLRGLYKGQYLARNRKAMALEVESRMLEWDKANPKPQRDPGDLDQIAEWFGFTSGDHMMKEIRAAGPKEVMIEGMTDQRTLERYGDLSNPDTLARAVDEAIHNEARARAVATELAALAEGTSAQQDTGETITYTRTNKDGTTSTITRKRTVNVITKAAKDFAAATIAHKKVRDIKPSQHAAAETRAAKAAEAASKKGDTVTAINEKRNQLIQNYATRLSYDALTEIDKAVRYLRKFDGEGTRKNLDTDYLDQIDQLLERFDLRASVTNKTADKRANLLAWVESQRDQGFEPDIPAEILTEALRKPYRELTLEELRGLVDTVKQIEHLGRLKQKLLTAKDEREFKAIRDEIAASIEANAKGTRDLRTRETTGAMLKEAGNRFLAMHRKMASVAREMDGFAEGGPMWEYFIRSMNEAGDRETTRRAEATARLYALVKPLVAQGKMGGKGQFFPTLGGSYNREERIAIALNLGNAGNMQRMLDGEGWTMARLQPLLDTITPQEADFVQAVWDFFESYRPEIAAKERRIYGKEPNWVEPVPITLGGKTLKGGYYPIKYDPARSGRAEAFADAEAAKAQMRGAYTTATTRRSFTKARAEEVTGRPLLYSFAGLYQGTNEVIHDLSWHEWLVDVNRLLRSLDGPIRTHYGAETVGIFKKAIEDIAAGDVPAQNVFERGLNHTRTGATIAGLGWNLMTSLLQPIGLTQSMVRVGPGWVVKGMSQWIKAPLDTITEINSKSAMMASRAQTMQREINEIQNQVRGSKLDPVRSTFFVLIQKMQMVADVPTWLGAYEKHIAAGEAEARAVALADQAVLDAQGGGQMKDLSQIQRGHPALKLFTNFYSFFNVAYNLGVEQTKQKISNPKLYPSLALDYLLLYVLPAAFVTVMKEAITGGADDDEEKLIKKIIADQISYVLGLVVGLREVTAAVQKVAGVEQFKGSYGGPAGLRLFQEIDKLGQQIGQGEADMAAFKAANNVGGIIFHYPSGQINRSVEGVAAMVEGKTANPLAVVVGPPKP